MISLEDYLSMPDSFNPDGRYGLIIPHPVGYARKHATDLNASYGIFVHTIEADYQLDTYTPQIRSIGSLADTAAGLGSQLADLVWAKELYELRHISVDPSPLMPRFELFSNGSVVRHEILTESETAQFFKAYGERCAAQGYGSN